MSRFNLLHTFLVYTLLLPCSLCAYYTNCKNLTCGGQDIPYPFGLRDSGCGLPSFLIDCVEDVRRVIGIEGKNYTLVNVSANETSTIVEDDFFKDCTSSYDLFNLTNYTSVFDSAIVIPLNITLSVLKCSNDTCTLDGVSLPSSLSCTTELVNVEGGLALWNITGNPLFQNCSSCESSGGWCGYNIDDPTKFVCFPRGKSESSNLGTIIGIAIGAGALIMIVALLLMVVYRKRLSFFKRLQTSVTSEAMNSGSIGKVENFLQSYIHQMPTRYSFSQLKKITNNFSDKLGEGGFGVVYKGKLRSGFLVAVKLLDQARHGESQFMNEVATLGTIHHVHLIRLMGYCFEEFRSALVYEYMANGSLEKFIFQGKEKQQVLNWDQLYSIALGAARGIAYLHEECSRRIIHFDIKPHNILLDADFTPKVADFGLAKLCGKGDDHVSITAMRGTLGYAAPELCSTNLGSVTDKSDVYSFGMLLLEIAGRRKNIDVRVSRSSQLYFPAWAFKLIESGELERRLRERGRGDIELEDEEKVKRMAKTGLWCIQYNSNDRPSMSRVVQMLEGNGDDVSNPPLPFNSSPPREVPLSSSSMV